MDEISSAISSDATGTAVGAYFGVAFAIIIAAIAAVVIYRRRGGASWREAVRWKAPTKGDDSSRDSSSASKRARLSGKGTMVGVSGRKSRTSKRDVDSGLKRAPSQFKGHTARLDDAFFSGASSGAIVTYEDRPML